MIVCVCHRVSDRDIERHVREGCASFESLQADLRVGTNCGRCTECAMETFEDACHQRQVAARGASAGARPSASHAPVFPLRFVGGFSAA